MSRLNPMHPNKLRWHCRRGMKELDALLERYLELDFPDVDDAEKQAFTRLLELSDPELVGYLLKGEIPEDEGIRTVIVRILGRS